jgi:outer membrane immunogenic protein
LAELISISLMLGTAMKRLAIALLALIGLSFGSGQIASAADLPVRAPMVAAPVPFSWTGFYVGGHLGGGWGTKEWSNEVDPAGSSPGFLGGATVNGALGGLQAGYNYQINSVVVLGIEGDFSWADVHNTFDCFGGSETCSSRAAWFASLTGRIGGTVDTTLFYLKGGVAWVHDKHSDSCPDCSATGDLNVWDASETRTGWTLGAGVEYAFTRNWSAKAEYDYMDFGTKTVGFTSPSGPENVDIQQRVHALKMGVNYKFDWGR